MEAPSMKAFALYMCVFHCAYIAHCQQLVLRGTALGAHLCDTTAASLLSPS